MKFIFGLLFITIGIITLFFGDKIVLKKKSFLNVASYPEKFAWLEKAQVILVKIIGGLIFIFMAIIILVKL